MSRIEDLERLKAKAERMRQEHDRAQGRLEESLKRLKEEFGVETIEGAQKLLKKLEREEETTREAFDTSLTAFNKEWGDKL